MNIREGSLFISREVWRNFDKFAIKFFDLLDNKHDP